MKIINKIIIAIILITISFITISNKAIATESWDSMKEKGKNFINAGKEYGGEDVISEESLQEFAMPIARTLLAIASVAITIVTVIMGMKYAISNPADKAKLKTKLIGLVVSAVVIFGAQGIWAMLYNFMTTVTE